MVVCPGDALIETGLHSDVVLGYHLSEVADVPRPVKVVSPELDVVQLQLLAHVEHQVLSDGKCGRGSEGAESLQYQKMLQLSSVSRLVQHRVAGRVGPGGPARPSEGGEAVATVDVQQRSVDNVQRGVLQFGTMVHKTSKH